MADRPTHELETPIGKNKVVFNDWITGGEKRELTNCKDDAKRQDVMVRACIVSIDGKNEDITGTVDGMHGKDFDFVFLELSRILIASSLTEEKKS